VLDYDRTVVRVDSERFWDERADENALFYVDNELDYEHPDLDAFWQRGEWVVEHMLDTVGLRLTGEETVVDIGCGVGRLTRALAQRTKRVLAVDVSRRMLDQAQALNPQLANVEWLHGDGLSLSVVADAAAHGCFSHVVFQHVPDAEVTLGYVRDMGRVVRPGGWALFQVSTDPTVHDSPAPRRLAGFGRRRRERPERAWWGSAVSEADLRAAAADGGLEIEALLDAGSQFTTVLARRTDRPAGSSSRSQ
jgi:SAM-dependent methyltransferase